MKTIRTAILGYGRSGSTMHAGGVEENDAFKMAAVCDIDPERRKQAADRFGCMVYEDYQEMLRKEKLDLVCVVTRSDQHCRMACDGMKAGVNVLVTKPWAANAAEANRMIACARRTGKKLLPWLPARWGCDLRRLKELVGDGTIGRVFLVRRIGTGFGTRCDWQTERRYAGGYLLNWGPHLVDPPLVLMNSKVQSVFGRLKQVINPGDVEDMFMAIVTLADGTMVQTEYTISPVKHPTWFLQGTEGAIVVNGNRVEIHRNRVKQSADPTQFSTMQAEEQKLTEETLEGELYGDTNEVYREIAAAIRGQREFAVRPQDALGLSRVLDAIRESSEKEEVVRL